MISPKDRNVRRRIPIRIKLAAALAIPITALLLVSLLEVAQSNRAAQDIKEQTELATASIGPGGLITSLQNERNYGSVWLLKFEDAIQLPVNSYEEATAATDKSIAEFRTEIDKLGGNVAETYEPALEKINNEIAGLREIVTGYQGERGLNNTPLSEPLYLGYIDLIDLMFQANGQVALAVDDSTLRRGVELTDLASRQVENAGRIVRVFLLAGVNASDGGMLNEPEEIGQAAGLFGQYESNMAAVHQLSIGRYEAGGHARPPGHRRLGFRRDRADRAGQRRHRSRCPSPTSPTRCPASPTRAGTGSARRSTSSWSCGRPS